MEIEELYQKLKNECPACEFGQNETFEHIEGDNVPISYQVDFTIRKDKTFVMAIQCAQNTEEENSTHYNYLHHGIAPFYSVVLANEKFFCSERNYRVESPKRDKGKYDFNIPQIGFQEAREISYEELVAIVKDFEPDDYKRICKRNIDNFFICHSEPYGINVDGILPFINEEDMEFDNHWCWLERGAEIRFMTSLLNDEELPSVLYRYTSSDTLYRIFASKDELKLHHSMSSLLTMNDVTEVDYANSYLLSKHVDMIDSVCIEDRKNSTHTFITSFSDKEDDLTMWRLYGNNAKGVCFVYDYNQANFDVLYFMLARVSYANKDKNNHKLDFIAELLQTSIGGRRFRLNNWHIWQHFFKPNEYEIESEIRLLAFADELETLLGKYEKRWITTPDSIFAPILLLPLKSEEKPSFPLAIRNVILCSKYPEKEMNKIAWEQKIKDECEGLVSSDFSVKCSVIDSYR